METGSAVIIFTFLFGICYIIFDSIPSKYRKLEESFGGFITRSLVRFEYEKSPLHAFVYGGTGTGKTYFIRQYLKLYLDPPSDYTDQNQNQNQDQDLRSSFTDQTKIIIIVCKDDRDWIGPETGEFSIGLNSCDINMITSKNKDTAYYFTEKDIIIFE